MDLTHKELKQIVQTEKDREGIMDSEHSVI